MSDSASWIAAPAGPANGAKGSANPVEVDVDRHAVVEASAGTGKTYRLERLVLQLLTARGARLDQILLVTYTEKAAGELKVRLRKALHDELPRSPEHRAALQVALDAFDQAHVYTIHGFCQRALQEYAFENRQEFRMQLADDAELLECCLREIQRKAWREQYGDGLRAVLDLAGYNGTKSGQEWERLVLDIARSFRDGCGHLLRPELLDNWPKVLDEVEAELRRDICRWRELAGPLQADRLEEHPWSTGFSRLKYRADWRESRRLKVLMPLLHWLADGSGDERPLTAFRRFLNRCAKASSFGVHGFLLLTEKMEKARPQLADHCPGLEELIAELEQSRRKLNWDVWEKQLAVGTVGQLQKYLATYKRERGLQSFEDMLTRVAEALDPQNPGAGMLLDSLRARYRYAVVDEFQDTDLIQWKIFRRIFVESDEHRLFVVGDPKQAIFGFRGADLHTYLAAGKEMVENHGAVRSPLDTNWRSCPELLGALNHLFDRGAWFKDTGITYQPVKWPDEDQQQNRIARDDTGRAALSLVDLGGTDRLTDVRKANARFIAAEIGRLLRPPSGQPLLHFVQKKDPPRPLDASDVCVLVFKRKEAAPLLTALQEAGIPYSFHKQTGLWQSDEALHLGYLLRALVRPGDPQAFAKALLTRFFRIRPEELSACDELPATHPVKALFQRWVALADQRNWAALFQSFLEETGVLHHRPAADAERSLANFRHVFQTLEQAAYGRDLDLLGVLDLLKEKQRRPGDDDSDLQPVETDLPRVRIMTIHAAKGLEFPVVFLAGGFTGGRPPQYHTYRDESQRLIFDLCATDEAKRKWKQERDAEDRRLLYVALTRAMFKLYLPRLPVDRKKGGSDGPVVRILGPALAEAKVETLGRPHAELIEPRVPGGASVRPPAPEGEPVVPPEACIELDELLPRVDPDLTRRRIVIRSFSSLHRESAAAEAPTYTERLPRADDDERDALERHDPLRGQVFGNMVHEVLEKIDFPTVGQAIDAAALLAPGTSTRAVIDEQVTRDAARLVTRIARDQVEEACRVQIARLVWNGLHTPLTAAGGPLWRIPAHDRLHELEFHFPELDGPPPAEVRREEGFLTGFMDLVFRRRGKYFLVDWKTNYLAGGYTPEAVTESMEACDYIRQYRLYVQALTRWLKHALGSRFDFTRSFGGVYYLYLRGMNGRDEKAGVFFHKPSAEDLRLDRVLDR